MRTAATIFVIVAGLLAVWYFMVRPILAQREQFREFFATLDQVEATSTFKIRMSVKGFKNTLWAWFLIIAPIVTTALQFIGSIDSTLVVPFIPEKYQSAVPLVISLIGIINLQLRKATTTPEGSPIPLDGVIEVPTVAGKPNVDVVVEPSPEPDKAVEVVQVIPVP
jgi:hypothetical protein